MGTISSMDSPGANPAQVASGGPGNSRERRRARRHKILTPAYANRNGSSQGAALELNAILNLSESGMCIQAPSQMKIDRLIPLGIDLAVAGEHIRTVGHVAWSDPTGKTGIRFPDAEALRLQLRHWLEVHVQTEAAPTSEYISPVPGWAAIEKEVERCGPDLEGALHLIAQCALTLTAASGAAIALISKLNPSEMICRARAGTNSPEIGARLEAGTGFSGECVRTAATLKCDDSESDLRVDRESCRVMGIRSIVACPVKRDREVLGILEVFSPEPAVFRENDIAILERLAGIMEGAIGRSEVGVEEAMALSASVEAAPNSEDATQLSYEELEPVASPGSSSWSRGILLLLAGLLFVGGAIWMGARWMAARGPKAATVALAPASQSAALSETYIGADLKDLQSHADAGDAVAEYQLAKRYAIGEDVKQDYVEAMRWFLRAADQGNVHAQAIVAAWMWAGRGAAQDYSQAYYWALLAQAGGDESGRAIVLNSAPYLSPAQRAAAQKQAEDWLHTHHIGQAAQ
jgi:GAF domain/Sel1 repeat/PilZ domain